MGGYTLESEIEFSQDLREFLEWFEENMTGWLLVREAADDLIETVNHYHIPLEVAYAQLRYMQISLERMLLEGEGKLMNAKEMERMDKVINESLDINETLNKEGKEVIANLLTKFFGSVEQREKEAQNAYR